MGTDSDTRLDCGGWLPIASAPKDGGYLLLFAAGRVTVGGFDDDWTGQCWVFQDIRIGRAEPSHWMPLPPPPLPLDPSLSNKNVGG